jgi:hypothetical protein
MMPLVSSSRNRNPTSANVIWAIERVGAVMTEP